jgi:hypothetical protein
MVSQQIAHPSPGNQESASLGKRVNGVMPIGAGVRYGLTLLYCLALCHFYGVLSRWWGYLGFTYGLNDDLLRYGACFVAAAPSVLLNPRPRTFAQAAAWFIYLLVYLPCLLVPVMQFSADSARLFWIFISTLAGCTLFLLLVRGDVKRASLPHVPPQMFWIALGTAWAVVLLIVLVSFGAQFRLVGADEVHDQRFAAGAAFSGLSFVRYAIAVLTAAIDPFLIAAGLYTRRYWIAGVGIISQVFLFGTLAARAVLLSPIFIIAVYFLCDRQARLRGNFLLIGLLTIFAITVPLMANYHPAAGGINTLMTFLYLRIFLISGAAFGAYERFFSINPHTYFSNNNIISLFIEYPYGDYSIGQVVQLFLVQSDKVDIGNFNASFLATDGMAALGVVGMPVASVLAALALRLMSCFIPPERTNVMVAAGVVFILSLANSSLLTSLVTGGGILLTLLVGIAPLKRD